MIGLMRFSALGDIANLIPSLRIIEPRTLVVTTALGRQVLEDHADRVLVLGSKSPWDVYTLIRQLHKTKTHLLIDLQNSDRSRVIRVASLKRHTCLGGIDYHKNRQCAAQLFMDLVASRVPCRACDTAFSAKPRDYIIINCGSSPRWASKRLPAEKWVQFSRTLWDRFRLPYYLTGNEDERTYVQSIADHLVGTTHVVAGKTSIRELKDLLSGAFLTVSTDSGPMHLSAVLKTPTIGLFGATNWYLSAPFGPWSVALHDKVYYRDRPPPTRSMPHVGDAYRNIDIREGLRAIETYLS